MLSTEDGNEHEANTSLEKGEEQERSKDFPYFGSFIASKGKVEKWMKEKHLTSGLIRLTNWANLVLTDELDHISHHSKLACPVVKKAFKSTESI